VQVIAAGARFVRKHERRRLGLPSANQRVEVRMAGADRAEKDGRIRTLPLRVSDGESNLCERPDQRKAV